MFRWWLQHTFLVAFGACGVCLGTGGCQGSEHVVLAPILERPNQPSGGSPSAGTGGSSPDDGGNSQPVEAGEPDAEAPDAAIDSGLDPDVVFDWTETLPGEGMCGPNLYVGSFSCILEDYPGGPVNVGQLSLVVAESGEGETTLLVSGLMRDVLGSPLLLDGTVEGTLECATNMFTATASGRVGWFGADSHFTATLYGTLDPETLEVLGKVVAVDDAGQVCSGSFQVGANL